jgi:hypothetical protein
MRAFILALSVLCLIGSVTLPDHSWAAGARIDENGQP